MELNVLGDTMQYFLKMRQTLLISAHVAGTLTMKSPIRKGDKLEHGGEVTGTCSPWTIFMNKPLARKGDEAICDLHGPTVIDEGAEKFPDRDGRLFALHDHRCVCGCRLISSLKNVNFA